VVDQPDQRTARRVTSGRHWLWRAVGVAFVGTALAVVGLRLARDWDEVVAAAASYTAGSLLLAFAAAMIGLGFTALAWRRLLTGVGHQVPVTVAGSVFFTSQLGKYVPGSVWPYLAQARLGSRYGVPASRAAQAGLTFVLLHLLTGVVVGVPRLLLGAGLDARFAWSLLLVPLVLVLVHPRITRRLTEVVGRLTRVQVDPVAPSWASLASAAAWLLLAWALYGVSLAALVVPLEPVGAGALVQLTSAYALAWSVGFVGAAVVVVAAPAGLGFREVALLATLTGLLAPGPAALVVVASRVLMTLADVAWAGIAAVVVRRRQAPWAAPGAG
jgi:uncharacterized membrane protein YbhN (UPF0104 family)